MKEIIDHMKDIARVPWDTLKVGVDLSALPMTVTQSKSLLDCVILVVFGFSITVTMLLVTISLYRDRGHTDAVSEIVVIGILSIFCLFFGLGFGGSMVLGGIVGLFRLRRMAFDSRGVTVTERGLFGTRIWSLPYTSFHGVLYEERNRTG